MNPGTRLGPYEILSPIGAGGMGEVYRARDTRLDRVVAVKVLPSHVASNPEVRQRFEREARAVSALNHPNICTLFDVGHQDGVDYLVMEHLEGETLAQRLERGALPAAEVIARAIEIADALDRAHRGGIVHRDLKPGNIMLTKSGTKLLDFGLAKTIGAASAPSGLTASPTMTSPLTAAGTIVGTFQYMAPEQIEGSEADARSDLFSLGVVLYEMATGKRAFEGKTHASLMASILKEEPRPITGRGAPLPAGLDRVVRQCLAKDPDDRWQSAGDLKRELRWIAQGASAAADAPEIASATTAGAPRRSRAWIPWLAAALVGAAGLAAGYGLRPAAARPAVMRLSLTLPKDANLDPQNTSLALSPDGTRLAFVASQAGAPHLWIRSMDSPLAQPLAGTEGASYPFWSPDGRYLGFFADQKLKKIQASGGTPVALCDATDGRGASWGSKGTIVFAATAYGPLALVSASGGAAAQVTTMQAADGTHRNPHFLPDGRHVLFFSGTEPTDKGNAIFALDVETKKADLVTHENSEGIYAEPGYLLFVREGNLMAQPFDARTLKTAGEAVPIAEKVRFNPARWTGAYTVSGKGTLAYDTGAAALKNQLTWFGLDGKRLGTVGEPSAFTGPRLAISPDGRRVVAMVRSTDGRADLWNFDLAKGIGSRFSFTAGAAFQPIWSPDGKEVAYGEGSSLFAKAADGASNPRTILEGTGNSRDPDDWSPDGTTLVFSQQNPETGWDVWIVSTSGAPNPRPFISTKAREDRAAFSPDGRWLSYISDESGKPEVYVVPYPGGVGKRQISSGGGVAARWMGDGASIIYETSENRLVEVDLTISGLELDIGASHPLLGGAAAPFGPDDLSPDGQRILVAVPTEQAVASPLNLVLNWTADLEKK